MVLIKGYVGFNLSTNTPLSKLRLVINSITGTFTYGLLQYSVHAPLLRVLRSLAWKLSRFSIPSSIVSTTEAGQEFLGILIMAISHSALPSRSRQARKFGTTMALKATKNVCTTRARFGIASQATLVSSELQPISYLLITTNALS